MAGETIQTYSVATPESPLEKRAPRPAMAWMKALWQWTQATSFTPSWLPQRWRHPLAGYAIGTLAQVLAMFATWLVTHLWSTFSLPSLLPFLVITLVALNWGARTAVWTIAIGLGLMEHVLEPPWNPTDPGDIAEAVIFIAVGMLITAIASQAERTRRDARAAAAHEAETAALLDAVIDAMTEGVYVVDRDGQMLRANTALRHLLALDPAQALRPLGEELFAEHARDAQGRALLREQTPTARVLRGEVLTGAAALPLHMQAMDGREIQVSLSGAPIRDRTGRPAGGVVVVRDETEQRRLERWTQDALATLLQMAETLVLPHDSEAASDPSSAETRDTVRATRRLAELAQRVLGCRCVCISTVDRPAALLHPLSVVGLAPDAERRWRAHVAASVPLGQSILASTQSEHLRAGEPLVIAARGLPAGSWPGTDGRVVVAPMRAESELIGLLAVGEWVREPLPNELALLRSVAQLAAVVVERRRLLQMQASAIRLEELDRIRTEFIAAVSHDLQTPLTSIRAGLGLIDASIDAVLAPDERDLLQAVRRNVERLRIRVNALLAANQLDAGALVLACVRSDLRDVALAAVATVQPLFLEKRQTLDVDLPEPLPVVCDPHRLEEVAVNLLANAHRHTPPGTHVALVGRVQAGEVYLRVCDSGPGIPAADLEAIFARFHRHGVAAGSGLGLSIARNVVELHRGCLWAESAPGRGATFHLRLPCDDEGMQA